MFPTSLVTQRALPLDTDDDHLPDRWEKEEAAKAERGPVLTALNARSDDDVRLDERVGAPHISPRTGDGLTAGEEYRGFFIGPDHKRTDEMQDDTLFVVTNPGGPFRKDSFIEDPDELFRNFGARTVRYGSSTHLITEEDSFLPPPDASEEDKLLEGQINMLSPDDFHLRPLAPRPQYRIKIVKVGPLRVGGRQVFGDSGVVFYSDPVFVKIDMDRLEKDLKRQLGYDLKPSDAEYRVARENLVAHEVGHRYTLAHHTVTVNVTTVLEGINSPLPVGESAALLSDGKSLRVRMIVERHVSVFRVGSVPTFPLQWPLDISIKSPDTIVFTPISAVNVQLSPTLPANVTNQVILNQRRRKLAGDSELMVMRTDDVRLPDELPPKLVKDLQRGHAVAQVRFAQFGIEGTPPHATSANWMDTYQGVYFPARTVPPEVLRLLDMKSPRP